MIRTEDVELKLLEDAVSAMAERNRLSVGKEQNSFTVGERLYVIKKDKVCERRLGKPFEKWVEESVRDRDGRPRTGAWANNMIHGYVRVVNLPALREFFRSGWLDEGNRRFASWATVVAAADYIAVTDYEKAREREIAAAMKEESGRDLTPEERAQAADQANDDAGKAAIALAMEKKSHHIRQDIRDHMAESPAYSTDVDSRTKYSFLAEKPVVDAFMLKAEICAALLGQYKPSDIPQAMDVIVEFLAEMGNEAIGAGGGDAGVGAPEQADE